MRNRNFKRNLIITALCVAIISMGIGFATLLQSIEIQANVSTGAAKWQIEITDITSGPMQGAHTKNIDRRGTVVSFAVDLDYPGAYATYDIVIENHGTINAKLDAIITDITTYAGDPNIIKYEIEGVKEGDSLNVKDSVVATITVRWEKSTDITEMPDEQITKTAFINLNYIQNTD